MYNRWVTVGRGMDGEGVDWVRHHRTSLGRTAPCWGRPNSEHATDLHAGRSPLDTIRGGGVVVATLWPHQVAPRCRFVGSIGECISCLRVWRGRHDQHVDLQTGPDVNSPHQGVQPSCFATDCASPIRLQSQRCQILQNGLEWSNALRTTRNRRDSRHCATEAPSYVQSGIWIDRCIMTPINGRQGALLMGFRGLASRST